DGPAVRRDRRAAGLLLLAPRHDRALPQRRRRVAAVAGLEREAPQGAEGLAAGRRLVDPERSVGQDRRGRSGLRDGDQRADARNGPAVRAPVGHFRSVAQLPMVKALSNTAKGPFMKRKSVLTFTVLSGIARAIDLTSSGSKRLSFQPTSPLPGRR